MQLSILIPCYNEGETISVTQVTIRDYMAQHFAALDYELILVNDGSTDTTAQALERLADADPRVRAQHLPFNQGRGAALRRGIEVSRGERIICLDADLSYDVAHIGDILRAFENRPPPDVVVVSTYMRGGRQQGVPFSRLVVSRVANWILSGFFAGKVKTVTCVVRGYRGDLARALPLFEDDKEFHLEILRKLALVDARIVEIPGRLVWNTTKLRPRRKTNLAFYDSALQHVFYGLLIRPAQLFGFAALLLLSIAAYESFMIALLVVRGWMPAGNLSQTLWLALSAAFRHTPHSFFIAGLALLLGIQMLFFLVQFAIMSLQHRETLRNLMALWEQSARRRDSP